MNLLQIIEKAKKQSIMPILQDDIGLNFNKDGTQVRVVKNNAKKADRYRTIFNVSNDVVKLSNQFAKDVKNGFGKNNVWNNFLLTKRKFTYKEIKTKIGNGPEKFEYYTSYVDENGKNIEFTEMRTRFVPIYDIEQKKELRSFVIFEGDKNAK